MADFEGLAQQWVKRAIRGEMARKGWTYTDLAHALHHIGQEEDEHVLRNKIARGTFSAVFFSQCLAVLGTKTLNIDLLDQMLPGPTKASEEREEATRKYMEGVAKGEDPSRRPKPGKQS